MARFKDHTGREWNLRLTLGILPDLKQAGCDLNEAVKSGDWLGDILFGDMDRLARILWELLREQAAGMDQDAFNRLIDSEFAEAAAGAMQSEIIDFFHRGRREQIKAQLPRVTAKLNAQMSQLAEQATDRALAAMDEKAASILSESAGSLAGTSG